MITIADCYAAIQYLDRIHKEKIRLRVDNGGGVGTADTEHWNENREECREIGRRINIWEIRLNKLLNDNI